MSSHGFRSFTPPLQRLLVAIVINTVGSTAVFAFALVYFHEVRHMSLGMAGLAVSLSSFAVMVLTPLGGSLSDRLGARHVVLLGNVVSVIAGIGFVVADNFVLAAGVSVLLGLGNALWWPAQSALVSLVVTPAQRPAVMAWQRAALNLGAALGGVLGGFIVQSGSLLSYRMLFLVNVVSYLIFLLVLPGMPTGRVETQRRVGYRAVLRDRFFLWLLVTDMAISLGFGYLWGFMPAYASSIGLSKATIGVMYAFGAACVAITQLPTLRWARGGRRMYWLMGMNAWFAVGFILMLLTPHVTAGAAAVIIGAAQVCGGFGEAILGAVRQPLTSDLAPAELVGRYFGFAGMVFQACMGAAVATGGAVLAHSASLLWLVPLFGSLAGIAGLFALRHRIPEHAAISH